MEVGKFKCGDEHKLPDWHSLAPVPGRRGPRAGRGCVLGNDPGEDLGNHLELLICRSSKGPRFLVFAPNPAAPYFTSYQCSRSFPVKYTSE